MRRQRSHVRTRAGTIALLILFLLPLAAAAAEHHRLSGPAEYNKYIDPLLAEPDFGVEYSEGGGGDASVLYPLRNGNPYARPSDAVLAIVRAGVKAFPALIDCLSDVRMASVPFDGNNITLKMDVPIGYVCLDILMGEVQGPGIKAPEEADGLGGGMKTDFYFRPNDYSNCWPQPKLRECDPEPWVSVVQANWRRKFLKGQLHFHNPYDDWHIPEYAEFTSRGLERKQ